MSSKQAPAGEDTHGTLPRDAYVLVLNIALVLLNAIEDYIGEDVIHEQKIHRLLSFSNFRRHGMLPDPRSDTEGIWSPFPALQLE